MYRELLHLGVAALLLSATAAVTRGAFNPNTDPALVAWYEFEGNARDSSPNALHGTEHGGPTYAPGVYGQAVEMDGQNDYIDCGRDPKFNITAQITFAYWIKVRAFDREWNTVFARGDDSYRSSRADFNMFMEAAVGGTSGNYLYTVTPVNDSQWHHVACVYDGRNFVIYIDGKQDAIEASTGSIAVSTYNVFIGDNSGATGRYWNGWIDDLRIYSRAFSPEEVKALMTISTGTASAPAPADKATDVPRDASLAWTAGPDAGTHDVYFGTAIADVNAAGRTDGKGVLASQGQAETAFDPAGMLAYGQTYYWRIDEVNKTPDNTILRGNVWSFTVEPYGYPIQPVAATASTAQMNMGPGKTIDGSGLNPMDLHGTEATTMWLSTGVGTNWIQYEFDQVYKLAEMKVWNSNGMIEPFMGFGAKQVKVEYSTDGTTWQVLAKVPEFAKAPGLPDYAANTTVNFGGVEGKFVKLTIEKNWGTAPPTGLSEVRFSRVLVQARAPEPAAAATGVSVEADLNWRPGREAGSHAVSFGTDPNALGAATEVTDHRFDPGALTFGTKYYWKVDEVNTVTYPGAVWSFTTQEFAPIDDFESYTDQTGAEVFTAWVDGLSDGLSNSVVGLNTAASGTFCDTTVFHGGKQSMPFEYNNVKAPYYSEATRTFDQTQDWTGHGADTLSLYLRGYPAGFVDKGNGAFTVSSEGTDIWGASDQFRFVYKQLSGDGSIAVKVDSLVNTNAWAKAGVMIRETIEANSKFAYSIISFSSGAAFGERVSAGAGAADSAPTVAAIRAPQWVKIARKGNDFTAQYSADGKTWLDFKSPVLTGTTVTRTVTMPANVYIGLCVTSHAAGAYTTAELSDVATTGTVTGAWRSLSIGVTQQANDPASLYLVVEDKAGKKKTAINPDPAAVAAAAWTEWRIPFSDLTGVNLAAVKKVTLGVGDPANAKPDGAGKLFIDDLGFGKPVR